MSNANAWMGTVGLNHRPKAHSTPFWDPTGRAIRPETIIEHEVLSDLKMYFHSDTLPPRFNQLKWDRDWIMEAPPGYNQKKMKYLKERTEAAGVWNHLKPRLASGGMTSIRTDADAQAYYNFEFPNATNLQIWVPGQPLTEDQVTRKLVHYPDIPQLIMKVSSLTLLSDTHHAEIPCTNANNKQAPLFPSPNFSQCLGANSQTPLAGFFQRCGEEIIDQIIRQLGFNDRAALQQACYMTARTVSKFGALWDVGTREFHFAEYTEEEFVVLKRNGHIPQDAQQQGFKVLSRPCFRTLDYMLLTFLHQNLTVATGHSAWENDVKCRRRYNYYRLAHGWGRTLRAFKLVGKFVTDLTMCGLPFLDWRGIAAICDMCVNLKKFNAFKNESVGFYQLVSFFKHYVPAHRKKHIKFDIAPAHESGPRFSNFNSAGERVSYDRKGDFGVSHADSGVKTNVALAKHFLYDFAPALYSK